MVRGYYFSLALIVVCANVGFSDVTLVQKYRENSTMRQQISMKTEQTLTLNGMDIITKAESVVTQSIKTGSRDKDGTMPLTVKNESMVVDLSLPGNLSLRFDSANPNAPAGNPNLEPLAEALRVAHGVEINATLDKSNKIVAVANLDDQLQRASQGAQTILKQQISSDNIKTSFNQIVDRIPTMALNVGDTWKRSESTALGSGQTMTFENEYTYHGPTKEGEKVLHKITSVAKSVNYTVENNAQFAVPNSDLKIDSSSETLWFDAETGAVIKSQGTVNIKGTLTLSIQGNNLNGQLDLTISNSSERLN